MTYVVLCRGDTSITSSSIQTSSLEKPFIPNNEQRSILEQQSQKPFKRLLIIRHGQATHNPRAEKARENGCSYEEFLDLIRQDDEYDAPLTSLGEQQAQSVHTKYKSHMHGIDLVVSSPLSRALQTADYAFPPPSENAPRRICLEEFREINGSMLNAKRRPKSNLQQIFPLWDFDTYLSTEHDEQWTTELESQDDCAERGYLGLRLLAERAEEKILVVSHGGILRFSMNMHDCIRVLDGRRKSEKDKREDGADDKKGEEECKEQKGRHVKERFGNCELREYIMHWSSSSEGRDQEGTEHGSKEEQESLDNITDCNDDRPLITLTEVTPGTNIYLDSDSSDKGIKA